MADPADPFETLYARGVTDGLPVIPPTRERVAAAVVATGRAPDEVIARVPPNFGRATVEKIAVNAVMAGCRPEYLAVVIAGVEAMCDEGFDLHGVSATTNFPSPLFIVNGPARLRLEINCGAGLFGPGWRANATIGRALRLLVGSLFGRQAQYLGDPALYTFCFGEDEERSPWKPMHVERGFDAAASTATVHSVHLYVKPLDRKHTTAEGLLDAMAAFQRGKVAGAPWFPGAPATLMLVLGDEYHRQFRMPGWDKARMRDYLFPRLTAPADSVFRPLNLSRPEDILIVAAGGLALASYWGFISFGTSPATRAINPLRRTA